MKVEYLKEKWYQIRRYCFKEGYVDLMHCDCINHPDNETISRYQLNSNKCYVRLNQEKWVNRNNLNKIFYELLNIDKNNEQVLDTLTASELFFLCETPYTYLED